MAKTPAPSDTMDKFMLRLPDGMRERIAQAARDNNRSMNAEIVTRIEESIKRDDVLRSRENLINDLGAALLIEDHVERHKEVLSHKEAAAILRPSEMDEYAARLYKALFGENSPFMKSDTLLKEGEGSGRKNPKKGA